MRVAAGMAMAMAVAVVVTVVVIVIVAMVVLGVHVGGRVVVARRRRHWRFLR
jgi:hypothetical protein